VNTALLQMSVGGAALTTDTNIVTNMSETRDLRRTRFKTTYLNE